MRLCQPRWAWIAVGLSAIGAGIVWATSEPSGLLILVAAGVVLGNRMVRIGTAAIAAIALGVALLSSIAGLAAGFGAHPQLIAFLATGLAICLVPTAIEAEGGGHKGQEPDIRLARNEAVSARAALQESEHRFRQLVDTVPTLIWCLEPSGEPSYFNKQLVDYCGLDVGDADTQDTTRLAAIIGAVIHPEDAVAVSETLGSALATGETFSLKYRVRRADGVYRWIAGRAEAMRDLQGRIVQWYGLCFDIEDEVRAQQALREREKQLKLIIDTVPGLIWSVTPDGEPSYYNKRLTDWGGVELPESDPSGRSLLNKAIDIIVHPDDRPSVEETLRHCFATGQSWNMRYRQLRADSVYRWIEGRAEPLRDSRGEIVQWYGLSLDIDDQIRTETALRQSEEQLRRLVDTVPALIWILTPEGEPSYYNKRLVDWFGIDVDGVDTPGTTRIAATIKAVVHPDDMEGVTTALNHSLATGEPYARRYRLRLNSGEYRWIEARCEPLRDENGAIVQWYGVNLDIDDEMRAEASLRQSERQLRQLVDTVPSLIWCLDPDGQPSYYNRRLAEWLGFGVDELDHRSSDRMQAAIGSIVHPDYREAVSDALDRSFATGDAFVMKYPQRTADGSYRWTEGRLEALRDDEGAVVHWYGVLLDIEDEVRVQDALRLAHDRLARASQAASLAELSASIAHEVNQPLAAIVANANACQQWLLAAPPNTDRARVTAERMIRDANSAADVISRIRALFKLTVQARSPTDINQLVTEVGTLMSDELAAMDVTLEFDLDHDLAPAFIDRVQIQQVVINLLRNGVDAMEEMPVDRRLMRILSRQDDADMIRIEVHDRGTGIEEPDLAFEAFYTTKREGMGMGLAICRSIIEAHGGRIWAMSHDHQGTAMVFTAPSPLLGQPSQGGPAQ
jgi:PAS domain S-box-containing protein